jgi:chemotaxis protein methyltransferase CheR
MLPDWTPNLVDDIALSDAEFREFQELVASLCGIHLSDAKRQLVKSRLQKRLRYHGLTSYRQYYDMVVATQDPEELTAFVNCITTNKTDFFREPHHFQYIAEYLVPDMLEQVKRGKMSKRLRVWHAGCSSGEEPYTMAITLLEALNGAADWDIQLVASDIDTNVLAQAERGVYPVDRVSTIPLHLLHKYFLRGRGASEGTVKVRDSVRQLIDFKRINLNDVWPIRPDTKFDVIFCRNVIIYFNRETQRRLFARFSDHIRPGGILFIGHSESLLNVSDAFVSLGNTIYQLPTRNW